MMNKRSTSNAVISFALVVPIVYFLLNFDTFSFNQFILSDGILLIIVSQLLLVLSVVMAVINGRRKLIFYMIITILCVFFYILTPILFGISVVAGLH